MTRTLGRLVSLARKADLACGKEVSWLCSAGQAKDAVRGLRTGPSAAHKELAPPAEGESPVSHCTIYTPARSASQQGMGNTIFAKGNGMWRIEFETESKWENPLMGWTSTADPRENVGRMTLAFDSKESAVRFAESKGWGYTVREPQLSPRIRTKRFADYGANFSTARAGLPVGGLISEQIGDKNAKKPAAAAAAKKKK